MKKVILSGLVVLFVCISVSAQDLPSITIVNNTGYTIWYVYVAPSNSDEWGEDILEPDEILSDGETFTYRLSQPLSKVKSYDIGLEDLDGDIYIKWDVSIANNSRIVFTFDDIILDDDD